MSKIIKLMLGITLSVNIVSYGADYAGIKKIVNKSPFWVEIQNERAGDRGDDNRLYTTQTMQGSCPDPVWAGYAPYLIKPGEIIEKVEAFAIGWQSNNQKVKVKVWANYPVKNEADYGNNISYIMETDAAHRPCIWQGPNVKSDRCYQKRDDLTLTIQADGSVTL